MPATTTPTALALRSRQLLDGARALSADVDDSIENAGAKGAGLELVRSGLSNLQDGAIALDRAAADLSRADAHQALATTEETDDVAVMGLLIFAFDLADATGLPIDELIDRVRQGR